MIHQSYGNQEVEESLILLIVQFAQTLAGFMRFWWGVLSSTREGLNLVVPSSEKKVLRHLSKRMVVVASFPSPLTFLSVGTMRNPLRSEAPTFA